MSFAGPSGKGGGKGLGVLRGKARGWGAGGEDPAEGGAGAGRAGVSGSEPMGEGGGRQGPALGGGAEGGREWEPLGWLGLGVAVGALLGAGIALLYAPQSGLQTRAAIRQRGRRIATQGRDAWDELAEELRKTARRRMKKMRRRATRAEWAAEDWREERGW